MEKIRIILADDHKLFVESLKTVIEARTKELEVIGIAYNGQEAVELVQKLRPHIALLDVRMPVMNGVEATGIIREKYPETQVVILTTYDDDVFVHDALSKGAVGYLLKDAKPANLIMSLLAVREGSVFISPTIAQKLVKQLETPMQRSGPASRHEEHAYWLDELTKREKEVLLLVAQGYTNKEIAQKLFIEEQTVKNHVSLIYSKIGIHDRIGVTLMVNKMHIK